MNSVQSTGAGGGGGGGGHGGVNKKDQRNEVTNISLNFNKAKHNFLHCIIML